MQLGCLFISESLLDTLSLALDDADSSQHALFWTLPDDPPSLSAVNEIFSVGSAKLALTIGSSLRH